MFDWLPYVVENYSPYNDGDDLVIRYVRGEFRLHRRASIRDIYWLLGLYQAEGSKKARLDWSFPSTTVRLLVEAIRVLGCLGIPIERLYLQVLHDADDDPVEVRTVFAALGPRIASVRVRNAHKTWRYSGGRGAVLHVERAAPFWRATMAALAHVFTNGGTFPSDEAARAFALGWLEGDGNIGVHKTVSYVGLHGTEEETALVINTLHRGFGWASKGGKYKGGSRFRSVTITEMTDLALANAFRFSMNRARLLYGLERGSSDLRSLHAHYAATDLFTLMDAAAVGIRLANCVRQGWLEKLPWKYRCSRYRLVPALHDLCARIAKLEPEMKTLRRFSPPERLGKTDVKGVPYPFEFSPYNDFE